MTNVVVPTERELLDALGVGVVPLDDGEATYLISVVVGPRELRLTYDLTERSVRIRISEGGGDIVDSYAEGLATISLIDTGPTVGMDIRFSESGFSGQIDVSILPAIGMRQHVLRV